MEFSNYSPVTAPCLLDELMDDHVITCDIDFGAAAVKDGYSSKQSPSHESDSGLSDMSEVRTDSPIGLCDGDDFTGLQSFTYGGFDDDIDDELASYFSNPKKSDLAAPEVITNTPIVLRRTSNNSENSSTSFNDENMVPQVDVNSSRILRGSSRLAAKKDDVTMGKATNTLIQPEACPAPVPAVKVVKVVKTHMGASSSEIDDHVWKALDERNKKNAVQAKINREKKKQYIQSLEIEVDSLKTENFTLKEANGKMKTERDSLVEEVAYLKNVLANQSALAGLLQNIGNVKNVKLSSSVMRKRSADHDHDYGFTKKRARTSSKSTAAGICLHVDKDNVSLEFCSQCANMAKSSNEEEKS